MFKTRPQIDYRLLDINRKSYNRDDEQRLLNEIYTYICVKYANEHPTPWNLDMTYGKNITIDGFDNAIDMEYLEKIMPEDFPREFEKYTTKELIRESQASINPKISKDDMIKRLMEEADWSWIVSPKGLDYLKSHPFCDFFATHLFRFNFYEFKLFSDTLKDELSLEEIGDEYINRKFSKNKKKMFLNYADYYHTLYLKKEDWENSLIYLAQRIIYEINTWLSKKYHPPFDEALSLESDDLLFEFNKLDLELDLDKIYDKAFNELEIPELKVNYDKNLGYFKRLLGDDDIFEISAELMDENL